LGTHRRLLGSEGRIGSFSLARDIESARKAIIVPEGGLESLVLTRSCLRGFKKRYPSCSVSVVTPGEYSSVLEGDYWTNRLFFYNERSISPFNRSLKELIEQLRAESFDIAIDLSYRHNLETYLPVSLSGAAITVGYYDPTRIFRYSISVRSSNGRQAFLPQDMVSLPRARHPSGRGYLSTAGQGSECRHGLENGGLERAARE